MPPSSPSPPSPSSFDSLAPSRGPRHAPVPQAARGPQRCRSLVALVATAAVAARAALASASRLPAVCAGCGEAPLAHLGQALCGPCRRTLRPRPPACSSCLQPLAPLTGAAEAAAWPRAARAAGRSTRGPGRPPPAAVCRACAQLGPPPGSRHASFWFEGPLAVALAAAKYRGQSALWPGLARLQRQDERVRAALWAADACAFVPSEPARLRARGYEHVGLLAAALAAGAERPLLRAVRKVRATRPQQALPRAARLANVTHAFVAVPALVRGRRLVLVDDVITSGATVGAVTAALLAAGAREVVALCLATPRARP